MKILTSYEWDVDNLFTSKEANTIGEALQEAVKKGISLSYLNGSGENLKFIHLFKAKLDFASFSNSKFSGAVLKDSCLSNSQFYDADLSKGRFTEIDFSGANFRNVNFKWSYFENVNFSGANFSNANLWGTTFKNCNLVGVDFSNVKLGFNSFYNCDFTESYADTKVDFSLCSLRNCRGLTNSMISLISSSNSKEKYICQTQKSRGMAGITHLLKDRSWSKKFYTEWDCAILSTKDVKDVKFKTDAYKVLYKHHVINVNIFPVFARPCPIRPRHGFVDSRVINSFEQLQAIAQETFDIDPESEIMLGKAIDADYSAILDCSSGVMTLGKGTDGATSGKNAIVLPLPPVTVSLMTKKIAGVKREESAYLEALSFMAKLPYGSLLKRKTMLVQMRAGPAMEACIDFIPKRIKVTNVIVPGDMSLLEWEATVLEASSGTIAYHSGGAIHSHYGVHCVVNGMPYITTECPSIGAILEVNEAISMLPQYASDLKKGIAAGMAMVSDKKKNAIILSAAILHAIPMLQKSPHAARLLGWACGVIVSYGSVACAGEMRHHHLDKDDHERDYVYEKTFKDLEGAISDLPRCASGFKNGEWSGGFGGEPWWECTVASIDLWEILKKAAECKEIIKIDLWNGIISNLNKTINLAHNNGWWLNKFIDKNSFDDASNYPTKMILGQLGLMARALEGDTEYLPLAFEDFAYEPPVRSNQKPSAQVNIVVRDDSSNVAPGGIGNTIHVQYKGPGQIGYTPYYFKPPNRNMVGCIQNYMKKEIVLSMANSGTEYLPLVVRNGMLFLPCGCEINIHSMIHNHYNVA